MIEGLLLQRESRNADGWIKKIKSNSKNTKSWNNGFRSDTKPLV